MRGDDKYFKYFAAFASAWAWFCSGIMAGLFAATLNADVFAVAACGAVVAALITRWTIGAMCDDAK